jgi:hypothetical protein
MKLTGLTVFLGFYLKYKFLLYMRHLRDFIENAVNAVKSTCLDNPAPSTFLRRFNACKSALYPPLHVIKPCFQFKADIEQIFLTKRDAGTAGPGGLKCELKYTNKTVKVRIRIVIETMKPVFSPFYPFLHISMGCNGSNMTCFLREFFDNFGSWQKSALETQKLFLTAGILRTEPTLRKAEA